MRRIRVILYFSYLLIYCGPLAIFRVFKSNNWYEESSIQSRREQIENSFKDFLHENRVPSTSPVTKALLRDYMKKKPVKVFMRSATSGSTGEPFFLTSQNMPF